MENFRRKSFWLETAGEFEPQPELKGDVKTDIAIIGGGFTGLSTAYHIKKIDPSIDVAIVENQICGYGASGRNAGFGMTLFGLTFSLTAIRFGKEKAVQAHHYMETAVDYLSEFITSNKIDCDYERPGFLRVATSKAYVKRIQHEINLMRSLGIEGIEWISQEQVRKEVNSPLYLGAWWELRCVLLNPAKLAWGIRKLNLDLGVKIFEYYPVNEVNRHKTHFTIKTNNGILTAEKILFATNAFSHLFPQLRRKQVPAFTYIVLTEPLGEEFFNEVGWKNRQGIEDARNLVHYYRLTKDNRLLMGGGDVSVGFGRKMNYDENERIFNELKDYVKKVFPVLKDVKFTHQWGGPVSVPIDMAPAIGKIGDDRAYYSLGCVGHGVSLTILNGKLLAELLLERKSELTEIFFVNRKTIPWPPEPIRFGISHLIRGYMRLEDKILDR
ncbi:NAD(P)/FAD-dependent oxidoreductase [Candidatus Kryptonium thompsonii]|uniref:NAD(P)/FAD-dependent oxidoreductase n=1 Tax=Candidatus Kryptonium thompsonii TaxID=1633631 RepID=UPI00070761BF|nr:FAD-dependent oxidoreductase [Candidatus Kryptonium thompsoni]CUT05483.1 Glycine/D-amino acid oxidase (deaminating) [Candidatus Kryptonium thompsoni]